MAYRILILTAQAIDAEILTGILGSARDGPFEVEWVQHLSIGLKRLKMGGIDTILLDLTLSDSAGLATFDALYAVAPHTPIMTLGTLDEEDLALEAVQRGAQGYLAKGYFASSLVPQTIRNIIQRKAAEENFNKEKARAEIALNSVADAVICTDMEGKIDYLNFAAETITAWSRSEAYGRSIDEVMNIINGVTRAPQPNTVGLVLQQNKVMSLPEDTLLIRRDGSEAWIEDSAAPIYSLDGQLTGVVIVFRDVSSAHAMADKMVHLAQHDFLTNLPNRVLLNDRIAQGISSAKRNKKKLAVIFLDLDKFKNINDSLGHTIGDQLLQSVAQRLTACVRASDTVCRQGGDEFVVVLTDMISENYAAATTAKMLAALALPHTIDGKDLHITASIGVSIYPSDGTDAESLIKNADTAMYHAKESGRNNSQFFRNEMNIRAVERQLVEANLREAIQKSEFVLHFQPKVKLENSMVTGAEALIRWMHPDWGMVMPEQFMPTAEECGLIVPIGRWVLRQACTRVKEWSDAGLPPITIAVNVSALEFRQKNFVENVRKILHETGLAAQCLELEITESVLMHDADTSALVLRELKELGVLLALDGFGKGYASLSYLKQFPIDALKIDQSFICDVDTNTQNSIIVSAVIGMGISLELKVIAEGIENQAQLVFLKERNCAEGQGFFFSKPITAKEFQDLLANGNCQIIGM